MSVLEACGVSFSYGKRKPLFENLNLSFKSEERVALCAPSGFGKTSLCRLLAGFEQPCAGRVLLDGKALPEKGASPVQLIGQHPELMLDPRCTLKTSLEEVGSLDEEVLEALGVRRAWLERYPHELSGGELQRCCIARAVRVKPQFLLADEATTMLDAVTQVSIWEFLLSYCSKQGAGLIFVSHSPALIPRIATRSVQLDAL